MIYRLISLLSVTFLIASCSSVSVVTDYDKTVNFGQYKTFNIKPPASVENHVDPERVNKRNITLITDNIRKQMLEKGYKESSNPDLWISFYVKVDTKQEVRTTSYGYYGGSPYYYGSYYGYGTSGYTDVSVVDLTEGTLIVDLVDREQNKLVWQGVAKKTINETQLDRSNEIEKAVGQLFYRYRFQPLNE